MSSSDDIHHDVNSQQETINFLKSFAPTIVETHISLIFLSEQYAYKLKKALHLPFLDFSQTAQRIEVCHKELELNRRTASDLYLDVLTIYQHADGQLSFEHADDAKAVDAVLKMRRFDDDHLLSKLAQKNQLNNVMMEELAQTLADFHSKAAVIEESHGAKRLSDIVELNRRSEKTINQVLGHRQMSELNQLLLQAIDDKSALLNKRAFNGKIRHCHGDLHLNNICLWEQTPTPFDCLEFSESMATTDVLYDLAFLLMDLYHYDLADKANYLMNRYMDHSDEIDGLSLLALFMSIRASIRAMVIATQAANTKDSDKADMLCQEAETFLTLGFALLKKTSPQFIAVGGLSGSGKSTLASALAPYIGTAPGARILSTDRIRKQLYHVAAEEKLPAESYNQASSNMVYRSQREQATAVALADHSVIVDGVFARENERDAIAQCSKESRLSFKGIWLEAPPNELMSRVTTRKNDPSDATTDVVEKQLQVDCGSITWSRLNSAQSLKKLIPQALLLLKGKWPW